MISQPELSIIIPTHNRADQLAVSLNSVLRCAGETSLEVVVVDNNSKDGTRALVESMGGNVRYTFEPRTAFTRARHTGAAAAQGKYLLFIDDDVLITEGSFAEIVRLFQQRPNCGVIAGHIDAGFQTPPPQWCLDCQKAFNGWSLYNKDVIPNLTPTVQEVEWAFGPMMAVRRDALESVGGFPPDTLGVESNAGAGVFHKIYVGPGDVGLCSKVRAAGFTIIYSPTIACQHIIPSLRYSTGFWRSRMVGEGQCSAIANRHFEGFKLSARILERNKRCVSMMEALSGLSHRIKAFPPDSLAELEARVWPEELFVLLNKSFISLDWVLEFHPELSELLWRIGSEGVEDNQFEPIVAQFPSQFKDLLYRKDRDDSLFIRSEHDIVALLAPLAPEIQHHFGQVLEIIKAVHLKGRAAGPELFNSKSENSMSELIELLSSTSTPSPELIQSVAAAAIQRADINDALQLLHKVKGTKLDLPFNDALRKEAETIAK